MKKISLFIMLAVFLTACNNDLEFTQKRYEEKAENCTEQCPEVLINIPEASGSGAASDSINNKLFAISKEIIYFGEKPFTAESYEELASSFIAAYDKMKSEHPEDTFGWEGKIEGKIGYKSEKIINIAIESYMFTGGAHGYSGTRSLLFDTATGKVIPNGKLFNDLIAFTGFAEKKFRNKFNITEGNVNSSGFMFENDEFVLPQNIFIKENGILLLYNTYEIASYADGPQELFIPMDEARKFLDPEKF